MNTFLFSASVLPWYRLSLGLLLAAAPLSAQCANTWSALPLTKANGAVYSMCVAPNGDLIAGGSFTATAAGVSTNIARWNGSTWSALGAGLNGTVSQVAALPNGDVIAVHRFILGDAPESRVVRWNGTSWGLLGSVGLGTVECVLVLPNGDLIVAGAFQSIGGVVARQIARWNGTTWSAPESLNDPAAPYGFPGGFTWIQAMTGLPNGDIVAGGYALNLVTSTTETRVARWNGSSWTTLGSVDVGVGNIGLDIGSLTTLANGDLVASVSFFNPLLGNSSLREVVRWDGANWSPIGTVANTPNWASTNAMTALPDGGLLLGGTFTSVGGFPANHIARWNGTSWQALGSGTNGSVHAIVLRGSQLIVGGEFSNAGGVPAFRFARLSTGCQPTTSSWGIGCPSSGGNSTLVATSLPWAGSTFRATGTGLPPFAIVLPVTSVTALPQGALPLLAVFPEAGVGCDLLVAPDFVDAIVTTTGTAQTQFTIPSTPSMIGVTFHQQMVSIEIDGFGNWLHVSATNAVRATIGAF